MNHIRRQPSPGIRTPHRPAHRQRDRCRPRSRTIAWRDEPSPHTIDTRAVRPEPSCGPAKFVVSHLAAAAPNQASR